MSTSPSPLFIPTLRLRIKKKKTRSKATTSVPRRVKKSKIFERSPLLLTSRSASVSESLFSVFFLSRLIFAVSMEVHGEARSPETVGEIKISYKNNHKSALTVQELHLDCFNLENATIKDTLLMRGCGYSPKNFVPNHYNQLFVHKLIM